jgi:tRNA pseudouridine38-40 synthase
MPRYFLEVSYKGTGYSGFQQQDNANSIQAEVEKAILILLKEKVVLTGSSRTDAGVHALQNYFHFDTALSVDQWNSITGEAQFIYKMNAILPAGIVVKKLIQVKENAHCRFDALNREYNYFIYKTKNPFLSDRAFFFPYRLDLEKMRIAADLVKQYSDFTSFSKRNTQVKTFNCEIQQSEWVIENNCLVYKVKANRFLRGMVRALTATMLMVGRNKISIERFRHIIEAKDCTKATFAVPSHGLFLVAVNYPKNNIDLE